MAPEQAAGDPTTDHRADLYALGIVGYEMLVGTPPFHGRAPQQLLAAHLTEKPPPIGSRRYDVPEALARCSCSCSKRIRPSVRRALPMFVRSLEDPAVVSGTFMSAAMPSAQRPNRVLWALAGAGILASVAAGGAWFTNRHAANTPRRRQRRADDARGRRQVDRRDAARQHQPRHERRVFRGRDDVRSVERHQPDSRRARRRIAEHHARRVGEPDRPRQVARHEHGARRAPCSATRRVCA